MSNKAFRGVGLHLSVLLGHSLGIIESGINRMMEKIPFIASIAKEEIDLSNAINLYDKALENKPPKHDISKIKKDAITNLLLDADQINKSISETNDLLERFGLKGKILEIEKRKLGKILEEDINRWREGSTDKISYENLQLKSLFILREVFGSIEEVINEVAFINVFKKEGIKLNLKYSQGIREALNINSIGYGRTAVLCAGRTIEKAINDYLKKLYEKKIIKKEDFLKFIRNKYHNKIGFLLSKKFIVQEEHTKLKAFSFDRDKGGHPDLGDIDNNKARTLILQGSWLILDIQNKIEGVKSEDDKARDLLGGESEAGQPILYGKTPEENLELLKGYGGKVADEMREEIRKEIEEDEKKNE